jgi:hypothetical protein
MFDCLCTGRCEINTISGVECSGACPVASYADGTAGIINGSTIDKITADGEVACTAIRICQGSAGIDGYIVTNSSGRVDNRRICVPEEMVTLSVAVGTAPPHSSLASNQSLACTAQPCTCITDAWLIKYPVVCEKCGITNLLRNHCLHNKS